MIRLFFLSLAFFLVGLSFLFGEEEVNATRFRFLGPEVVKIDWNARSLHAADLNDDGLTDLALVNRDRSRIEVLYRRKPGQKVKRVLPSRIDRWEPVLDDAPYVRENFPIDEVVTSLTTGDLDADGKLDMVYGGAEDGVHVRFRNNDNSWSDPLEVDAGTLRAGTGSLDARDLDGDGSIELLALVEKGLEVFRFDGRELKGQPVLYREDSERSRGLLFADIDGDGHDDWLYLAPGMIVEFAPDYGVIQVSVQKLHTTSPLVPE